MAEAAEFNPITSRPSWFSRIKARFQGKPPQEVEGLFKNPPDLTVQAPPAPTAPMLSRQERRRLKQEKYEKWKATSQTDSTVRPKTRPAEISGPIATEVKPEIRPADLPYGVRERVASPQELLLTREEIPWLEQAEVKVPLELMTLDTTNGEKFLYGDFIHGKRLLKAMSQMREGELRSADTALFVQLSELIQKGRAPDVEKVHNHVTGREILETGNQAGQRVYFMRFDRLQGIPVIIRIAVANKDRMIQVFRVISTESQRLTKKKGKL